MTLLYPLCVPVVCVRCIDTMAAIGQGELEYHKLFRVMQTVGEMMTDRKYQVATELIPRTFHEFLRTYVDQLSASGEIVNSGGTTDAATGQTRRVIRRDKMTLPCERRIGEQVLHAVVFFTPPNRLTSESMKEYLELARRDDCHRVIFVTPLRPNAIVRKNVDNINRNDLSLRVEVFEEDDLAVNITKHELVPLHTPLEVEEVKAVLQAHALELHQLPRILSSDPVAAYYGLERGQVVRIERTSMSAGIYVTYRQVV